MEPSVAETPSHISKNQQLGALAETPSHISKNQQLGFFTEHVTKIKKKIQSNETIPPITFQIRCTVLKLYTYLYVDNKTFSFKHFHVECQLNGNECTQQEHYFLTKILFIYMEVFNKTTNGRIDILYR